jgi:hypothetical protein
MALLLENCPYYPCLSLGVHSTFRNRWLSLVFERFPDICQKKFGRTYDFAALEKRFAYVRRGRRELVTKDVLALFDISGRVGPS